MALFTIFLVTVKPVQAGRLYLNPGNGELSENCDNVVHIMIDTEGIDSNAADAVINYNSNEIEIIDQDLNQPGDQLKAGNTYTIYAANIANETRQKLYLTAVDMFGSYNSNGTPGTYGSIVFRGKPGVSSTTFTFDFTLGDTTDSNIADLNSDDILTSIGDGSYTFIISPFCGADTEPPVVINIAPAPGSRGVPLDSNITFDISDDLSGVDIDTLVVIIDGVEYRNGDSGFSFTGDKMLYSITIDSLTDFPPNTPVYVDINTNDLAGNIMNTVKFSFNHPLPDNNPPFVTNRDPVPNSQNVPLNSNVTFHVKDIISGVDINTVVVRIDGVIYRLGDNAFSYSNTDEFDYLITINPANDFPTGQPVYVEVDAADLRGLSMNTDRWSFNHPVVDLVPPYVRDPMPAPGSRGVLLDSNVTFHILDDLSGVDINTVKVEIDGVAYDINHGNFSSSGNPQDYFIVIDPVNLFPVDTAVYIKIDAFDLAGNKMNTYTYSFNHPISDLQPPYVRNPFPENGLRQVDLGTNITFNIRDNVSGVDLDSLQVRINGVLNDINSGELIYTGDPLNYAVILNPATDLPADTMITIEIDAIDLRGNIMDTYIWSFNRPAICGDNLVEVLFGEQCEPPDTACCDAECHLTDEVGVCGNNLIEVGESCEPPGVGSCSDKCTTLNVCAEPPDYEELAGLDTDQDGISDLSEILDYGSDPNDPAPFRIRTRITNWKNGDVTGSKELLIKGVSHAMKKIKVYAITEQNQKIFLMRTRTNDQNLFANIAVHNLEEGVYFLQAESYEDNGDLIDRSPLVKIIIDYEREIPPPIVDALSGVPVDELFIRIFQRRPTVYGSTIESSQVFAVFQSLISSATIVADSINGDFAITSAEQLDLGAHEVTLYAVTPEGLVSGPVVVEFEILPLNEALISLDWLYFLLLISLLVFLIAEYYKHKRAQFKYTEQYYKENIISDLRLYARAAVGIDENAEDWLNHLKIKHLLDNHFTIPVTSGDLLYGKDYITIFWLVFTKDKIKFLDMDKGFEMILKLAKDEPFECPVRVNHFWHRKIELVMKNKPKNKKSA